MTSGDPWRVRFAELLVRRVAATDLARLSNDDLNDLLYRFYRFRTDDGPCEVSYFNGLLITDANARWSVEGDKGLTSALVRAVNRLDAEIRRRLPQTIDARWSRYERYERRRQRLGERRLLRQVLRRTGRRNRERRPRAQRRLRVRSGSRGDPPGSPGSDDDDDLATPRRETA